MGCSKKSDPSTTDNTINPTTTIIGNWRSGTELDIYYAAGKEVYRRTTSASAPYTQYSFYYTFKAGNIMNKFEYGYDNITLTDKYVQIGGDFSYSFSNSNQTLTYSYASVTGVNKIAFTDINTMTLTQTINGAISVSDGHSLLSADSYTSTYTFSRF